MFYLFHEDILTIKFLYRFTWIVLKPKHHWAHLVSGYTYLLHKTSFSVFPITTTRAIINTMFLTNPSNPSSLTVMINKFSQATLAYKHTIAYVLPEQSQFLILMHWYSWFSNVHESRDNGRTMSSFELPTSTIVSDSC